MTSRPTSPKRSLPPRGFTLIELLAVITIIAILAALTMGTFSYVQQVSRRNNTTVALSAIVGALKQYDEKHGGYPEPANPTKETGSGSTKVIIGGALMLYQAITGDGNDQIKLDNGETATPSNGTVDANERGNAIKGDLPKTMVLKTDEGYMLIDAFGRPFQYDPFLYDKPTAVTKTNKAVNTTFDVWSYAQKESSAYDLDTPEKALKTKKDEVLTAAWIKNW